jgi:stage II sporulation protein AA (anti-sigma F factor antagonist)
MLTTLELRHDDDDPKRSVLAVHGELDIGAAPQLKLAVADLMGVGVRHVVVDLSDTGFLDSAGLGVLLWASRRLHAAGGDLAVANPIDRVRRTFELTGLKL